MVRAVVAAASVAAVVIDTIMAVFTTMIVDAVVPTVMAHLMLALFMVGRIIAAAACLSDRRHGDGTGDS